jgi:uncharacterized lipoprotein YddW (UPF0748 family)
MRALTLLILWIALGITSYAQNPKREFRGAWIATVGNIDYPSTKTLSSADQQAEFKRLLDLHKQSGINAVMVQIRTNCDAFYPSKFAPWSEFLTGKQGRAPEPYYDPVAFMISECKQRGIEFHAWFNPYRSVANVNTSVLDSSHISKLRPDWLLPYGNLRILDPGNPEVIKHVTDVVMEVANNYDIDGVHFDDYFYPYPVTGQVLNDSATYAKNPRGITNRGDWRRDNVNILVKTISDSLKNKKPWVKFGISPFGIWQNKTTSQPLGSATGGLQGYSDIYCDARLWLQNAWIDYVAPQIYWNTGLAVADFSILLPWWANNSFDRHLYIGHAAYRINATDSPTWQNPTQMPTQINMVRATPKAQGSIFYNTTSLNKNPLGFRDSLRTNLYATPALMPAMAWKDAVAPSAPTNLIAALKSNGILLQWIRPTSGTAQFDKIKGYVVYRFPNGQSVDITKSKAIIAIIPNDTTAYLDVFGSSQDNSYTYLVTAIDRLNNESPHSLETSISLLTSIVDHKIEKPELYQNYPNPFIDQTAIDFKLARSSNVTVRVTDMMGHSITILKEHRNAGNHSIVFQNTGLPPGMYIYSLETSEGVVSKRMIMQ